MAFSVKVDEDLPRSVAQLLREHGYDALTVVDQQMSGWKDQDIWRAVQREKRFLVTADKGFADIRKNPPGQHSGIMLLRPDEDGIRPLLDLLRKTLRTASLETLAGAVVVASSRGVRVRR